LGSKRLNTFDNSTAAARRHLQPVQ